MKSLLLNYNSPLTHVSYLSKDNNYIYDMGNTLYSNKEYENISLKCIIIDDERDNIELLELMLINSQFSLEIIDKISDSNEALDILKKTDADLVFLDIKMPGMNGFEILENLEVWNFNVVFTTAYDHFAIQALRLNAFDYLLKPIEENELEKVIVRLKNKMQFELESQRSLLNNENRDFVKIKKNKIFLDGITDVVHLDLDSVIYFEADGIMSRAIMKDDTKIFLNEPIKKIEEEVRYRQFFRVHRSFLINITEISKISKKEGNYLIMSDNKQVPIAKARKSEFIEYLRR
jgi:two-component system LytT family response regulator